jgi:hypothetical protein
MWVIHRWLLWECIYSFIYLVRIDECKWQLCFVWCCPFGLWLHVLLQMVEWWCRDVSDHQVNKIFLACHEKNYDWCYFVCFLCLSVCLSLSSTIYIYMQLALSHMNTFSHLAFTIIHWSTKHNASPIICFNRNVYRRWGSILNSIMF